MTKVPKLVPDAKQTAARLDTWRGFATKYGANCRHLLFSELGTQDTSIGVDRWLIPTASKTFPSSPWTPPASPLLQAPAAPPHRAPGQSLRDAPRLPASGARPHGSFHPRPA